MWSVYRLSEGGGMPNSIRIGAVEYLNSKPLTWGLHEKLGKGNLLLGKPSQIADVLRAGELDVALIPSIEYLRNPDYRFVPDVCIASRGAVMSAVLICRKPPARMERVALDTSSRSSAALCRILFRGIYRRDAEFIEWSPETPVESVRADGFLVIGDTALRMRPRFEHVIDMGEEWQRLTELPFVYALWAGRRIDPDVAELLRRTKQAGVRHLAEICQHEAECLDIPVSVCLEYLTSRIHYDLGPAERGGLKRFRHYATQLRLCPSPRERQAIRLEY
jgi:chorismate dehydratase